MTYKQLKKDVARLGFETVIEDEDVLLGAANSALELIYLDRPRIKTVRLFITPLSIPLHKEKIDVMGEQISIALEGDAYSFTTVGRGSYTISDDNGTITREISLGGLIHRGLIKGNGNLIFSSEGCLSVFNLCCFYGVYEEADIPLYSSMREIDVTDGRGDLRSFCRMPYDEFDNPIKHTLLRGERLLVPIDYEGDIFLDYYRTPAPIVKDNDEQSIDISAEMAPLLPLLTASFLWLDDDSDKAQYYLALYRQSLATIMRYSLRAVNNEYETNGWG